MLLSDIEPFRRRGILLGTAATRAELELSRQGRRFLADQSLFFVDINSGSWQTDRILQRLSRRGLVEIGSFLLQSPTNEDRYERLPSTARAIAQERIDATVHVCQQLGARKIRITHAETDLLSERSTRSGRADSTAAPLPTDLFSSGATGSQQIIRFDGLSVQTSWVFEGKAADVDAATRALAESGIYDENLEHMISLFRSKNKPLSHSFEISTESEIRRVVDLLAEVGLPFIKLQAEFDSFRQSHTVFRSQITSEFGPE